MVALWAFALGLALADVAKSDPMKCLPPLTLGLYKTEGDDWCEQFCVPLPLVPEVKQFGDVHNGRCDEHGFTKYNHTEDMRAFKVDLYTKEEGIVKTSVQAKEELCCECIKAPLESDLVTFSGAGSESCSSCCEKMRGSYHSGKSLPESTCSTHAPEHGTCGQAEEHLQVVTDASASTPCLPPLAELYKTEGADWCEQFCVMAPLVKEVEQFGDVQNGRCDAHGFPTYDHTADMRAFKVDLYRSAKNVAHVEASVCCECSKGTDSGSDLVTFTKPGSSPPQTQCETCCKFLDGKYMSGKPETEAVCSSHEASTASCEDLV